MPKSHWSEERKQYAENKLEKLIQERKETYRLANGFYELNRDDEDIFVGESEIDYNAVGSFLHFRDEIAEHMVALDMVAKEENKKDSSLLTGFLLDVKANKDEQAIIGKYYDYVLQEKEGQKSQPMREEEKCIRISRLTRFANEDLDPNMYKQVKALRKGMDLISHSSYNNDKKYTPEKHLEQTRGNNFFIEVRTENFRALESQIDEMCFFAHYKKDVVLLEVSEENKKKVIHELEKQSQREAGEKEVVVKKRKQKEDDYER